MKKEPEITLKLSVSAVNVIIYAMGKRPLEEVAAVWLEVKKQSEEQLQEPQDVPVP